MYNLCILIAIVINSSYKLLIKFTASPIISSSIILCGPGIILMLYRCTVHSKPLLLKVPKLCIFLLPIAQNRRISNPFLCAHEFIYLHFLFTIMPKVEIKSQVHAIIDTTLVHYNIKNAPWNICIIDGNEQHMFVMRQWVWIVSEFWWALL